MAQAVFAHVGDQKGMDLGFAAVIQRPEILIRIEHGKFHPCIPSRFASPVRLQKRATQRWPLLIGKTFSSLGPSAGQHLTAVGSSHSFAETVFHFPMPFLRLIRTKHPSSPFRTTIKGLGLARLYYITSVVQKSISKSKGRAILP